MAPSDICGCASALSRSQLRAQIARQSVGASRATPFLGELAREGLRERLFCNYPSVLLKQNSSPDKGSQGNTSFWGCLFLVRQPHFAYRQGARMYNGIAGMFSKIVFPALQRRSVKQAPPGGKVDLIYCFSSIIFLQLFSSSENFFF